MATHSSVLAWRIPGTEEPSELPSMGSHRVGHASVKQLSNSSSSSKHMRSGEIIKELGLRLQRNVQRLRGGGMHIRTPRRSVQGAKRKTHFKEEDRMNGIKCCCSSKGGLKNASVALAR